MWHWMQGRNLQDGPTNGNWCSKNWSGGLNPELNNGMDGIAQPVDSMDDCCKTNDQCYGFVDNNTCSDNDSHKKMCDDQLLACLQKLDFNPNYWPKPPRNGTVFNSILYKGAATLLFK